jgi:exonuclease III
MHTPRSVWTWNVNRRSVCLDEQAGRVLIGRPDVVCLQEVTPRGLARWTDLFEAAGYTVQASEGLASSHSGVLIASPHPLTTASQIDGVPWPARALVAKVQLPVWEQALHVVCLHAPLSQDPEKAKVLTLEAVHTSLCGLADGVPAILCGDLNTPQFEEPDGTMQTFAYTRKGHLKARLGKRHDEAEQNILSGPDGWRDAFRRLHGTEARDRSWRAPGRGTNPGFRLDHILLSPGLTPVTCAYDHIVRAQHLSDHSAMYATIVPTPVEPTGDDAPGTVRAKSVPV